LVAKCSVAKEEILTIVSRDKPVAVSYEEVDIDRFVLQRDLLGFVGLEVRILPTR
jgi:hypothetical protein